MKQGKSLLELATELDRQAKQKRDFVVDTRAIALRSTQNDGVILEGVNGGMPLRRIAHQQLAQTTGVPQAYYDKMLAEAPDLLAKNVNTWLEKQLAKKLVRAIDGQVRAILSSSYLPLDNLELAESVLPGLIKQEAQVLSSEITESRMYLKAVTERISGEVSKGDVVQAGIILSNSEVGQGSLKVESLDCRLVCLNGMISERSIRKAHLGRGNRNLDAIEDAREFFRDETRIADDRAFFLKVGDAVGAMFDQVRFNARIEKYKEAQDRKIEADPIKVVEVTAKRFGLNEGEKGSVLQHLLKGGSLDAWGLANSITRAAQDVESYDRSVQMEELGSTIIELSPSDWKILAA